METDFKLADGRAVYFGFATISWQRREGGKKKICAIQVTNLLSVLFLKVFIIKDTEAITHAQNKESKKDLAKRENFYYADEHLPQTHPSVAALCGILADKLFQLEAF